ncbi:MAG TPA: hypothetical protein VNF74_11955 [Terriglobales bacterium]|nr:hypothetical protein [Terriglobales bacterium]
MLDQLARHDHVEALAQVRHHGVAGNHVVALGGQLPHVLGQDIQPQRGGGAGRQAAVQPPGPRFLLRGVVHAADIQQLLAGHQRGDVLINVAAAGS